MYYLCKHTAAFLFLVALSECAYGQDDLSLGRDALQRKSYDTAIVVLSRAQKAAPRVLETNFYLGEAFRLKGVKDSAEYFLQRAVEINETYLPAWSSLGTLMIKTGQWDKAAKVFAAATKADKKSPAVSLAYANAYLDIDSLDKAIVYFSKAKELDENLPEVYVGLAESYGRQNIAVLAISNFQKAAELDSTSAVIRYKLGKAYYKNRQYNDCVKEFEAAINLDPKNDVYVFDVADIFYRAKLWRESALFFAKYVALKKDNPVAYDEYGKALFSGKYYKDALPVLEQAITLNPKAFDLKPMLARSEYETGDYQKAVDNYKVIPRDSLGAEDFVRIGRSYARLKMPDSAIANFEKAGMLDTASTEFAADLAPLYMGKKMYDKAADQYDRKLKSDPKNVGALVNGGVCYMVIGKYDTAKTMMQKVIELRPDFFQAYLYLAKCYYLLDSYELAEKQYQLVISIIDTIKVEGSDAKAKDEKYGPQLLEANKFIGLIELLSKHYPSAIENLKKAITYESKEKKDSEAHLWLAQSYALSLGDKTITVDAAQALKDKAIEEYKVVLKIDPKNAAANKELKQLEGG